jgi:hypothetical protein
MKNRTAHGGRAKLEAIVRAYIRRIRPRAQAELDWFAHQPSLSQAIETAALAVTSQGKRYSHQRRVTKSALEQTLHILSDQERTIQRTQNFDDLFNLIDTALRPVRGIGELYVYDTSLRIGAKLNLLPTKVYLHAGTRDGARALRADASAATLEVAALPREFHCLEAHEIEDILCIFKNELKLATTAAIAPNIIARSWCS